jgi:hypothetical protein
MVVVQAVGQAKAALIDPDDAKAEIRRIENENKAIRASLLIKVGNNETEAKREEALLDLRTENPLFAEATLRALDALLPGR